MMKSNVVTRGCVLAVVLMAAELSAVSGAAEADQGPMSLSGVWVVEEVQMDGRIVSQTNWPLRDELEFSGDKVIGLDSGDKSDMSYFELTPGRPSRIIRFLTRNEDGYSDIAAVGIVRFVKERVQWCEMPVGDDVDAFPDTFTSTLGDRKTLITLRKK